MLTYMSFCVQHVTTVVVGQRTLLHDSIQVCLQDCDVLMAGVWLQEAYGKLQEWTVSSEAASHKLAQRAGALQEAMQVWVRECDFWSAPADITRWCRLLVSGVTANPKTAHAVFPLVACRASACKLRPQQQQRTTGRPLAALAAAQSHSRDRQQQQLQQQQQQSLAAHQRQRNCRQLMLSWTSSLVCSSWCVQRHTSSRRCLTPHLR